MTCMNLEVFNIRFKTISTTSIRLAQFYVFSSALGWEMCSIHATLMSLMTVKKLFLGFSYDFFD